MKPRIFISAVSKELKTARQLTANTLLALGFEPVWQDIFETHSGDIRPMLREKLDNCSAVLQIVGDGYGAEPPVPDEHFGRVSYTQYEALYAAAQGKKVYYLIAGAELPRDAPPEQLDPPRESADAARLDSAERKRLQAAYRTKIQSTEHIYYAIDSNSETELTVRRLKNDLERLRRWFQGWMLAVSLVLVLLTCGLVFGGVWLSRAQKQQGERLDEIKRQINNPERTREQLQATIFRSYEQATAEADKLSDWRKRQEAKTLAGEQRDQNLARVDEFLQAIAAGIESGRAAPEYLELVRVFNEQGAAEAIAYIAAQQERLLGQWDRRLEQDRERLLLPILQAARYEVLQGDLVSARKRCDAILTRDPTWGDALHEQFWILTTLGNRALRREGASAAEPFLQQAADLAKRLAGASQPHPYAERDLLVSHNALGDLFQQQGESQKAFTHYQEGLKISQKRVVNSPFSPTAQRDLSVAHDRQGDVLKKLGNYPQALVHYSESLKIRELLAAKDEGGPEAQRDLAISHNKLGDVLLLLGLLPQARTHYEADLAITVERAKSAPSDAQMQRDLSIAKERLGDLLLELGNPELAQSHYEDSLKIRRTGVEADTRDAQSQRDLSIAHNKLGDSLLQLRQVPQAIEQYEAGLAIRKKLAAVAPGDIQTQLDLVFSYRRLGSAQRRIGDFTAAKAALSAALELTNQLLATGQTNPRIIAEKASVAEELAVCEQSLVALGDWDVLLDQPAERLPQLLALRCTLLAAQGRLAEVRQAAEKLAAVEPQEKGNLYNAACGFGLALKLASGWDGKGPFPPAEGIPAASPEEKAVREQMRKQAIATLKLAIAEGWNNFAHLRIDADLAALHGEAEFEALFPKQPPE
jgi:tetratricopeptide (TPR) repeat protein